MYLFIYLFMFLNVLLHSPGPRWAKGCFFIIIIIRTPMIYRPNF